MLETVKGLLEEVRGFTPKSEKEVEVFRLKFLGKKGKLNELFNTFKSTPNKNKKEFGQAINILKKNAEEKVYFFKGSFAKSSLLERVDLSRPVNTPGLGSKHPISLIRNRILSIFKTLVLLSLKGLKLKMIGIIFLLLI